MMRRLGQLWQSLIENLILMTSLLRLSMAGVQLILRVAFGAGGLLGLPIDVKLARREALFLLSLPFDIGTGGANQIDAIILLTAVQQLGIDIARIDDMLLGQQFLLLEPFMNAGRSRIVGDRSGGRFDMGDQVRAVFLTGFRQMNLKSHPTGGALLAVVSIEIIGRTDIQASGRDILRGTPAQLAFAPLIVLDPHAPQNLHRWHLLLTRRGRLAQRGH